MRITNIEALATPDDGYRFKVTFDDAEVVELSAHEVQDYRKFQQAVLKRLGKHYRHDEVEFPRRTSVREWSRYLAYWLGRPPAASDTGVKPAG